MKKTLSAVVLALAMLAGVTKSAHASYDGTPSTGSFTIVTNSALAEATATATVTVVTTTSLSGTRLNVGPYTFVAGRDFAVGASTVAAATSLKNAINASLAPVTAAFSVGDAAITLSGKSPGTLYNSVGLATSASGKISVSGANLSGGQNNAVVYINAIPLVQGRDWFVADVSSNTAIGLAGAINAHPVLSRLVNAQPSGSDGKTVYLRSVFTPAAYKLSSSAGAALTASQAAMTGGSQGLLLAGAPGPCFLGTVAALPSSGYPAGCLLYLTSDPTKLYISTQAVLGTAAAGTNSWLAK